jgi:AbrB family looped-hinge helix DNA binding protein
MQTIITKRGQTVVPSAIRKKYRLSEGDGLIWLEDGATIKVIPVPGDPVTALRGSGKGEALNKALLEQRKKDRERE